MSHAVHVQWRFVRATLQCVATGPRHLLSSYLLQFDRLLIEIAVLANWIKAVFQALELRLIHNADHFVLTENDRQLNHYFFLQSRDWKGISNNCF